MAEHTEEALAARLVETYSDRLFEAGLFHPEFCARRPGCMPGGAA